VNADFVPTPREQGGVPVYLRSNGIHADLVLPAREPHDWTRAFPWSEVIDFTRLPGPAGAFDWIAFGWGDREFYLTTPTWRELRAHTAWRALSGQGRGAMHVEYIARPDEFEVERVTMSHNEYRAMVDYVRTGFAHDARGGLQRIDHPGFGATDAFYEGTGSYSPWFTSNDWVRRGLSQAGVRTAVWSPFDRALFWQVRRLR
jgi:uncharacterized protein (TIGR02117 family)